MGWVRAQVKIQYRVDAGQDFSVPPLHSSSVLSRVPFIDKMLIWGQVFVGANVIFLNSYHLFATSASASLVGGRLLSTFIWLQHFALVFRLRCRCRSGRTGAYMYVCVSRCVCMCVLRIFSVRIITGAQPLSFFYPSWRFLETRQSFPSYHLEFPRIQLCRDVFAGLARFRFIPGAMSPAAATVLFTRYGVNEHSSHLFSVAYLSERPALIVGALPTDDAVSVMRFRPLDILGLIFFLVHVGCSFQKIFLVYWFWPGCCHPYLGVVSLGHSRSSMDCGSSGLIYRLLSLLYFSYRFSSLFDKCHLSLPLVLLNVVKECLNADVLISLWQVGFQVYFETHVIQFFKWWPNRLFVVIDNLTHFFFKSSSLFSNDCSKLNDNLIVISSLRPLWEFITGWFFKSVITLTPLPNRRECYYDKVEGRRLD